MSNQIKKQAFAALATLAFVVFLGCTKDSSTTGMRPMLQSNTGTGIGGATASRPTGGNYSQPITVDTANRMIESYLKSQNYPSVDNSLRSLSFDADTLRAYLSNPNVVTLKFMLAHQPGYINSGGYAKDAGMNPSAMTMVIVGLNENNQMVRNSSNGVYEHLTPCPNNCSGETDAYIH